MKSGPTTFQKTGFIVIKEAVSKEIAEFVYKYFLLKRKVFIQLKSDRRLLPFDSSWGTINDPQIPNTYSHYGDIAMETLLTKVKPRMEEITGLKLTPTYSYARIYKPGDILYRHKDRPSCEISTTLNLGGDPWPIYIDPTGENNILKQEYTEKGEEVVLKETAHEGKKVDLEPGDMLVYRGHDLEHWRNAFEGKNCGQVFLHYNEVGSPYECPNDGRPFIGLPDTYKGK
jgi:hypothetical protein